MKKSTVERVQKHRDKLRQAGLRPIQLWIPDARQRGFAKECLKQSMLLRGDQHERDTLDRLNALSDREGWV
ncbi:MAG: antitoxin MazE family protein [Gammaproteobacteria bacterium]|nr:antitoxin MazE family protein [Gammaproteobacteria bacterium]MBY0544654.1 antitoxin MazE family protein [Gammaproteobacteria bacterium]